MTASYDKNKKIYITAVLPAHDEHAGIANAIKSIRPYVNRIIVACDNCSDNTASIASHAGADTVFNTVYNFDRKAGALNQGLKHYVNWQIPNQYILIMDADTQVVLPKVWFKKAKSLIFPNRPLLDPKFRKLSPLKREMMKFLDPIKYHKNVNGRAYDCVGSIFQAPSLDKYNYIEEGQRLEWIGYRNKIERSRKVAVLTGTCSLISANMLYKIYLHYNKQQFYNDQAITEDFQMTVDLKDQHARLISPSCCLCITATKPTASTLIAQRKRWDLGALDVVSRHPMTETILPYLGQQIMLTFSVFSFMMAIFVSLIAYVTANIQIKKIWLFVFVGFDFCQVIQFWKYSNTFDKLYSISMFSWLGYSFVLDIAYLKALESFIDRKKLYWNSSHRN